MANMKRIQELEGLLEELHAELAVYGDDPYAKEHVLRAIKEANADINKLQNMEGNKMSKNELVKTENTELMSMTGLDDIGMAGFDFIDPSEDLKIPTAKLLQALSPELEDEDSPFKAGQIINTMSMEVLPDTFIPLMISKSNIMFVPRNEGDKPAFFNKLNITPEDLGGDTIVCRSNDAKYGNKYGNCKTCPHNKFQKGQKPLCNETINILALFPGQALPVILQLAVTNLKHGKQFIQLSWAKSQQDRVKGLPAHLFMHRYKIAPKKIKGAQGSWFETPITPVPAEPTQEEIMQAFELYKMTKDIFLNVTEQHNTAANTNNEFTVVDDEDAPF